MKKLNHFARAIVILLLLFFPSCRNQIKVSDQKFQIVSEIGNNTESPFYLSFVNYPEDKNKLPIGIFDSGTGGLTVLNTIYQMDQYNNGSKNIGTDGLLDFNSEGKADFLRELVIKDVRFLLGKDYYNSPSDHKAQTDKQEVKAIVIACNTATAYGLETVQKAIEDWGIDVRVIGIVDAGSKAVLQAMENPSSKIIGVLASEGACSSQAYPNSIVENYRKIFGDENVAVVQQAGIGLAGAIDGDLNYIDPNASNPRDAKSYQGPDIGHLSYPLDLSLWEAYNFEVKDLLTSYDDEGQLIHAQLNSVTNYIRYMVTHMMENIKTDFTDKALSRVILGCTHYPYFEAQIREHFLYLKSLNEEYDQLIDADIQFVDPSEALAMELYEFIKSNDLWGDSKNEDSQFYISVPNPLLAENTINEKGEFPYDYKYGRTLNSNLQYVKVVPFSDEWIKETIQSRMKSNIPYTHKMIYQN